MLSGLSDIYLNMIAITIVLSCLIISAVLLSALIISASSPREKVSAKIGLFLIMALPISGLAARYLALPLKNYIEDNSANFLYAAGTLGGCILLSTIISFWIYKSGGAKN